MGAPGFTGGRVGEAKAGSRSGSAGVGFSSWGVEVNFMIFAPLARGVNVAWNNSAPEGLEGRVVTSSTAGVGAGESVLFTRVNSTGLPNMAVVRVTTALIMATNIGVSNFFSGFFSRSGRGSVGVPRWGAVRSFEDDVVGSEEGIIVYCGTFLW